MMRYFQVQRHPHRRFGYVTSRARSRMLALGCGLVAIVDASTIPTGARYHAMQLNLQLADDLVNRQSD